MSPQEMQKRSAEKRRANSTPEQRSEWARLGALARHAGKNKAQITEEMRRIRALRATST